VTDAELVAFLQWARPRLRMRWKGFRKVRGQVKKRVARRLRELGLALAEYRAHLEGHADEWAVLDGCCRISISRFRYLAFTYFDDALQREIATGLRARLAPGGRLFLGRHETMPAT